MPLYDSKGGFHYNDKDIRFENIGENMNYQPSGITTPTEGIFVIRSVADPYTEPRLIEPTALLWACTTAFLACTTAFLICRTSRIEVYSPLSKIEERVRIISEDAKTFLHKNHHLIFDVEEILIRLDALLTSQNLEYEKEIYLRRDVEVDDWEVFKIKVKINKGLDEVLDIWEIAAEKIYKNLGKEARENILLSFDTF